uniref:Cell division protein FtsN n=1 Tax=Candidatus Kentrum sp. FM TaxID=2126340 RepID=A0A450SAL1_9GAMM|nr:MAG: Cell division protein FtsN [Candidatus Kentron sp. FM]VFJ70575.1 MAG: Cell division protein FtsN [Candidatus Kentron sp. FM]VFK11356.1 MAG: Cell division protein FtsN [Candidatus Kentron sp. FM]
MNQCLLARSRYITMAHDYKYAGKTPSSSSESAPPPGWLWFLAGLAVGLFITVLTYLSVQYSAGGTAQRADVQPRTQSTRPAETREKPSLPSESAKPAKPAKPADTTGDDKKKSEPRFEFYTILPEREIQVPEHELHAQERAPKKAEKSASASASAASAAPASAPTSSVGGSYILQVGSFRHLGDADKLKAGLVIKGFDVEIQTVSTNNNDVWYRVRLGPYEDLGAVHRIRTELQKSGFSPLVLREKP